MARKNTKAEDYRVLPDIRLAGGRGALAAKQSPEALLRRVVMANLLWERLAYIDGLSAANAIAALVPQVQPDIVANIAIEARTKQKLRHVPLLIAVEMTKYKDHRARVGELLPQIILRPDEIMEYVSLYWEDGKAPLAKQVKLGLAKSFDRFDEYQFAKYNRGTKVKLRDVMFLVHPKPPQGKEELYRKIANNSLATPDTWEVGLSSAKNESDKAETFTRLIMSNKLGGQAFLRNLRNMTETGVSESVILHGFETINPRWLLPLNYLAAAKAAPQYEREIEALMFKGLAKAPKLPGKTILIVDVSGSMGSLISEKSIFNRLDCAIAMSILSSEMAERISIYATAGYDMKSTHKTRKLPPRRGFGLPELIHNAARNLGGGGIFTRQCLEYIREQEEGVPDRIIVISDSQDCDISSKKVPFPFGNRNYIIDVSSHTHGVAYDGIWTAEIVGWSEHFLDFIAALEGEGQ